MLEMIFDRPLKGGDRIPKTVGEQFQFFVKQDICNLETFNKNAMALKIIDYGTEEYKQMLKLREEVLRKPLGLNFSEEELEREKNNLLIAAYDDEKMLACCMLVEEAPQTMRLRQMAVVNDLQGKGIGKALILFAENLARDRGYQKITMHARKIAAGFYEKMGYEIIGDEFTEITIPHYVMEKSLYTNDM